LTGCSSEKSDNGGAGGSGGTGSTGCDTDYATIAANAPTVSFQNDIMPILGLSCVAGECHNVNEPRPRADLVLGVKCAFDAAAKWKCTFPPTSAGPDLVKDPQPLTQTVLDTAHASMLAFSKTVPSLKRVEPFDPSKSFLLDKTSDTQGDGPYQGECTNQDPTKSQAACGGPMPITGSALCLMTGSGQDRFNAIVQWIAQGALEN
jgi:hypothetical protein